MIKQLVINLTSCRHDNKQRITKSAMVNGEYGIDGHAPGEMREKKKIDCSTKQCISFSCTVSKLLSNSYFERKQS